MRNTQILNKLVSEIVAEKKLKVNEVSLEKASILCELAEDLLAVFSEDKLNNPVISVGDGVDICIYVDDLVFRDGRSHPFFEMIMSADYLILSKSKKIEDSLEVRFGIDNLWATT